MNKGLNVLSLFDGMSCGHIALDKAGIKINTYYASEINKYSIKVTQHNYSETVQLGDVQEWKSWMKDLPKIDLILAGSPCQGFSIAGKQLNFNDPRSKLFFEFVNILNWIREFNNPDVKFILENVKMKQEFQGIINQYLNVEPISINSCLLSAQNRRRLYWTNIEGVTIPEDKGIMMKDIVHESLDGLSAEDLKEYIVPLTETFIILNKKDQEGKVGYFGKDSQANRVYYINGKGITLTGEAGGGAAKMGQYLFGSVNQGNIEGYIRKLTPVECERLQTVPDGYTNVDGVSEPQRYKMLGNGWTVDVIVHILQLFNK